MRPIATLLLCLLLLQTSSGQPNTESNNWWRSMVVYQVYPRSFKDSDGDGIGDLNGITNQLEHLVDAGARCVWLSPIFASPQKDFGYDISNFTDVDPTYGTLADFRRLTARAAALGLKVLLDFVPNHSSDLHPWFQKSVERVKPYDSYYVWRDGKVTANGTRQPPNNWLSRFGGSAWEWSSERRQYYLHQFLPGQPDLDYRNPILRAEMRSVLSFWLDLGVSGFRVDSVDFLVEDVRFLDEPRSNLPGVGNTTYEYLNHIYTRDQNETYDVVREWRRLFDEHAQQQATDRNIILTEAYTSIPNAMRYYDAGSDVPFNFMFIADLHRASTALEWKRHLHTWLDNMPRGRGYSANWVTGNHDNSRVASRFGPGREDQTTALAMVLPGIAVVYNGDEIGMVDREFTYEETVDPAGCAGGREGYRALSRDPERTPYQWDDTRNAGFSTANKTWLPLNDNYKSLNLRAQRALVQGSHYKVFQAMVGLKSSSRVLREGSVEIVLASEKVLGVVRRLDGFTPVVLLINFATSEERVDANGWLNIPAQMTVRVASVKSGILAGTVVDTTGLRLPANATIVLGF